MSKIIRTGLIRSCVPYIVQNMVCTLFTMRYIDDDDVGSSDLVFIDIGTPFPAQGLVELVDIYPTLVDLLGVEPPGQLQGQRFVPLLADIATPGKEAVFPHWKNADVIKTEHHALTTWSNRQGEPVAEMMFDHETDRDEIENNAHQGKLSLTKRVLRALFEKDRKIYRVREY